MKDLLEYLVSCGHELGAGGPRLPRLGLGPYSTFCAPEGSGMYGGVSVYYLQDSNVTITISN